MRARSVFLFLLPALLLACNSDPAQPDVVRADNSNTAGGSAGSNGGGGSSNAGAGGNVDPGMKGNEAPYPEGPYGLEVGNVVTNFKFSGLRNPKDAGYKTATPEIIAFSDFYNPTGDASKPRYLVVTSSARWCSPCNQQASESMKDYAVWQPKGVEFLDTLFDSDVPGTAADYPDLENWTKKYGLGFPVALDPNPPQLGAFFNLDAAPFNMVLDTTTMKILFKTAGLMDASADSAVLKKYVK